MKNPVGAKSPHFICLFAVSLIIRVYSRACSLRRLSATPGAYLPKRQKETKKILYYGEWAVGRDDVGKTL